MARAFTALRDGALTPRGGHGDQSGMPQRDTRDVSHGREAHLAPGEACYALRHSHNQAFRVRDRLRAAGFETWLPTYREESRWSDRTKTVARPLFPGYLFARFDAAAEAEILRMPGVAQVLKPAIDEAELENVRRAIESRPDAAPCAYIAGEAVRVRTGPLAGVTGIVTRTRGHSRLIVSIEILKRAVWVEIDARDVEKKEHTK